MSDAMLDEVLDLAGVLELGLREVREQLEPLVEKAEALRALRDRAVALAAAELDRPVTWDALLESADGEEDRARLGALLETATRKVT